MNTSSPRTVDYKEDIAFYDQMHVLSSEHIRETVFEQWNERVLTDEELAHITESIMENVHGFLYDEICDVIGSNI